MTPRDSSLAGFSAETGLGRFAPARSACASERTYGSLRCAGSAGRPPAMFHALIRCLVPAHESATAHFAFAGLLRPLAARHRRRTDVEPSSAETPADTSTSTNEAVVSAVSPRAGSTHDPADPSRRSRRASVPPALIRSLVVGHVGPPSGRLPRFAVGVGFPAGRIGTSPHPGGLGQGDRDRGASSVLAVFWCGFVGAAHSAPRHQISDWE
jgi:hypothetical protein